MKKVRDTSAILLACCFIMTGLTQAAGHTATPYGERDLLQREGSLSIDRPSAVSWTSPEFAASVDFPSALTSAADYLKAMQADVTEDNAGNGTDGVDESPDDPDDGGWDWIVTSPPEPFFHTAASSPKNLYGATSLGLYHAYLETSDASYMTAMTDAADVMVADADIWSADDIVFLVLYNDLPEVSGTAYADAAKTKFDARITGQGSATGLAEDVRDVRAAQGHTNGIIAWDVGKFIRAAVLLAEKYPSDPYDYTQAAADMAEVLWQDSYNDNPGHFDIVDDAGWDPAYSDRNFWFYTLGVTGLIDAFSHSNTHTDEIPGLVGRLLDSQYPSGGLSYCYGANTDDEDWQSTAYGGMALGRLDRQQYQNDINHMAYWLAITQDASGGWRYAGITDEHLPEVAAECLVTMYYATDGPIEVVVDDDFTSQTDVDAYNITNGTAYIWGFDAFATIQEGVDAVSGSTIYVEPGTYREQIYIDKSLDLVGSGIGVSIIEAVAVADRSTYSITQWSGTSRTIDACVGVVNVESVNISGFTVDGRSQGQSNFYGIHFFDASGSIRECQVEDVTFPGSPGTQSVLEIVATHSDGAEFDIEISDCFFYNFQKGAIAIMGPGSSCTVDRNDVNGVYNPNIASNGIQISYGCTGTLTDNAVSGVEYPGLQWASTGILLIECADVTVSGGSVTGCETGISHVQWNFVHSLPAIPTIVLDDISFAANQWSAVLHLADDGTRANFEVKNCFITGTENVGVNMWGSTSSSLHDEWTNGVMTVYVHDNRIEDGNIAVREDIESADGCTVVAHINGNSFEGNLSYGVYNNFSNMIDAVGNWWGETAGPTVAAPKAGLNEISRQLAIPYGGPEDIAEASVQTTSMPQAPSMSVGASPNVDYSPWWGDDYVEDSHVATWTWYVDGSNSSTIQEGIDCVTDGDFLHITAATYTNDPTNVNKTITLLGVQADVDPAGSTSRGIETIITREDASAGILITAPGVTVNGFQLGTGAPQSTGGISIFAGATDVSVKNCIVVNTDDDFGDGIHINATADGAIVTNNTVSNAWLDGIVNNGASEVEIADNWVIDCDNDAVENSGRAVISGNTIQQCGYGIRVLYPGTGYTDRTQVIGNTISFTQNPGIYVGEESGSAGQFALVSGNSVHACNIGDPELYGYASVHIDGSASNCTIDGNDVSDGVNGIQLWASNLSVTNNEIHDMGVSYNQLDKNSAILVGTRFGTAVQFDPTGNLIFHNRIFDNRQGLYYASHLVNGVDAENNYWGDTTGPYQLGANPDGIGDPVSGDVDYKPWCNYDFTNCSYTANCCGKYTGGLTGNANCSEDGAITLSDISRMIDRVFVSKELLCCEANGNTNGDPEGAITLGDITRAIDKVYISKGPCEPCE